MQKRVIEKFRKDPLVRKLGTCLNGADANLIQAGKIILKLRVIIPNCDQVLLELYPQILTPHKLDRLALCGKNELISDFVGLQGTLGKKLGDLPVDLQKKVYSEGVEVVIGGTASKPNSKRYAWHELQPGHAAQVFDNGRIRDLKEQVFYRAKKVKSVLPAYSVTGEGIRVNRGCLIPWLTLSRIVRDNLSPLTGVSGAEAPAQAAVA